MADKKHTAEQLRKAQEIVDQEEAIAAERTSRRRRRREEWSAENFGTILVIAMVLIFGALYVIKPFGDFSQTCRPLYFTPCRPSPQP